MIVVGGGVSGCACAAQLAVKGIAVTVISSALDVVGLPGYGPTVSVEAGGWSELKEVFQSLSEPIRCAWLNASLVPASGEPMLIVDRRAVSVETKRALERIPGLEFRQALVTDLRPRTDGSVEVESAFGEVFSADAVVLAPGLALKGRVEVGEQVLPGGRYGEVPANDLAEVLARLGVELKESEIDVGFWCSQDSGEIGRWFGGEILSAVCDRAELERWFGSEMRGGQRASGNEASSAREGSAGEAAAAAAGVAPASAAPAGVAPAGVAPASAAPASPAPRTAAVRLAVGGGGLGARLGGARDCNTDEDVCAQDPAREEPGSVLGDVEPRALMTVAQLGVHEIGDAGCWNTYGWPTVFPPAPHWCEELRPRVALMGANDGADDRAGGRAEDGANAEPGTGASAGIGAGADTEADTGASAVDFRGDGLLTGAALPVVAPDGAATAELYVDYPRLSVEMGSFAMTRLPQRVRALVAQGVDEGGRVAGLNPAIRLVGRAAGARNYVSSLRMGVAVADALAGGLLANSSAAEEDGT